MKNETDFLGRMQRIEGLTREVEAFADVTARAKALELMQLLMEYHGAAIERALEIMAGHDSADQIFADLANDELTNSLLLLYELHPLNFETRVEHALARLRPYLSSQGVEADILSVEEGVIRLQVTGSKSCPSTSERLKQAIEEAIMEAAPETVSIVTEVAEEQRQNKGLVQIQGLRKTAAA